jgi:hypothetical protein
MKKFLFIYRSSANAEAMPPSAADVQEILKAWGKWKEAFPQILDMGDGLLPAGKRFKGGTVTDGPQVESKEIVSGYSIVSAASYEDALRVAKACPINHVPTNSIEIRELAGY